MKTEIMELVFQKFNVEIYKKIIIDDQGYSVTRVPTQVNNSQQESAKINTSRTQFNTCQLDQEFFIVYRSSVGKA